MSDHDLNIEDQPGVSFLPDLNAFFQAILTKFSKASAPLVTVANMDWHDSTNDLLMRRNKTNTGWITCGRIADPFTVVASQAEVNAGTDTTKAVTPDTLKKASEINGAWTTIASAATCDVFAVASRNVLITGTTAISNFGTAASGMMRLARFAGAVPLTYNATSLIIEGGASIVTAAGDTAEIHSLGGGNVFLRFKRGDGTALVAPATGAKKADRQVFTATGTWTKPSGFSAKAVAMIEVIGGGGGGGRAGNGSGGGTGGGGGGRAIRRVLLSALGSTESVTVGAGGLGGTSPNTNGGNGGNSSFGSWLTGYGGCGGTRNVLGGGGTGGGGHGGKLHAAPSASGTSDGEPIYFEPSGTFIVLAGSGSIDPMTATAAVDGNRGGGGGGCLTSGAGLPGGKAEDGGGGGGGGGAGISQAAGAAGPSKTAGAGGAGGAGGTTTGVAGTAGVAPGGGGGGGGYGSSTSGNGGNGADGQVIVTVFDGE